MKEKRLLKRALAIIFLLSLLCLAHNYRAIADSAEFREAISLFKKGSHKESLRLLESIPLAIPLDGNSEISLLKGYCYIKLENLKEAVDSLEKATQDDFILADYAHFKLGDIYMREKKYADAIEEYENLTKIHPESILADKSKIKIARCLIDSKEHDDAIEVLKNFITDNPKSSLLDSARFNLAIALEEKGKIRDAWKTYHEVSLYHPLSPYSRDAIASFKRLQKKYKLPYYSAPAEALFAKGMAFYKKGDFVSASYLFRRLIKLYPYSSITDDALVKLGQCEYRRRLYTSSIAHYKEAIKRGGDAKDKAQYYMAFSYGRKGNLWKALSCLQKVIKYYPSSSLADDAQFYIGYYYDVNRFKSQAIAEYKKVSDLYPESDLVDNALWEMGKIYYLEKKYHDAYKVFEKAVQEYELEEHAPKCAFWKAKCAEKLGWKMIAIDSYRFIIKRFDHTYYSYRAKEKLKDLNVAFEEKKISELTFMPEPDEIYSPYKGATPVFEQKDLSFTPLSKEEEEEIENVESAQDKERDIMLHYAKYEVLMKLGMHENAVAEASYIVKASKKENKDAAMIVLNSALYACGRYKELMLNAEKKCSEAVKTGEFDKVPPQIWQFAYPRVYYKYILESSLEFGMDPYLILAVIREESRFDPGVVSWAKAHGLMQIIPSTGSSIARLMGIRPYYRSRLFEPRTNIRMGTYYLSTLLKRFGGNVYLALAAYNGGPNNVKRWWSKKAKDADIDEFVEYMPYYETRRYVQKVMKSYKEYIRIYKGS